MVLRSQILFVSKSVGVLFVPLVISWLLLVFTSPVPIPCDTSRPPPPLSSSCSAVSHPGRSVASAGTDGQSARWSFRRPRPRPRPRRRRRHRRQGGSGGGRLRPATAGRDQGRDHSQKRWVETAAALFSLTCSTLMSLVFF